MSVGRYAGDLSTVVQTHGSIQCPVSTNSLADITNNTYHHNGREDQVGIMSPYCDFDPDLYE